MARGSIERDGWVAAGVGLALAGLVFAVPLLSYVFSYFLVLVHEMGHACFGWLYGYPSIPAFDFVYGGGVTSRQERLPVLAVLIQGLLGLLCWAFRRNRASLILSGLLFGGYALTAWTPLHRAVITAMGHGFELLFAGIFLHRALSGSACKVPAERPLYGFVGFFVTFYNLRFAHRLMSSSYHRELYADAKGGGHWMDFSVLAEQHFHVSVESLAALFLAACLLPPVLSVLVNTHREAGRELAMALRRVG